MDKFFTDQVSKEHNVLCVEYKGGDEVKIIISDNDGEHEPKSVRLGYMHVFSLYRTLKSITELMEIKPL